MKTLRLPHTNPRFAIALVVIAAGYALFSFLTPFQYDDFAFLGSYLQHSNNDPTFSLDSFLDTCAEIRKYDNGRLANILDLFVIVCVPKWIFDILTGAVTAGIFYFITVFIVSCAPRRAAHHLSFPVVTVCWALSMVALPWRNNMLVPDYALNYLYSSFFNLLFLYLAAICENKGLRGWNLAGACVTAFVAAAFHEGFSAPIGLGLLVFASLRRLRLRASWWAVTVSYAIGALAIFTAPVIWQRTGREVGTLLHGSPLNVLVFMCPLAAIFLIMLAALAITPAGRKAVLKLCGSQVYIVAVVALAASFIMCLILDPLPRNAWLPEILAEITLMGLIILYLPDRWIHSLSFRVSAWSLLILTVAFMANVLRWQYLFYTQDREIHYLIKESTDGTVYYDVFPPEHLPKTVLYQPAHATWIHNFHLVSVNQCNSTRPMIAVVPTALRDFSINNAKPLRGEPGFYTHDNVMVYLNKPDTPYKVASLNGQRGGTYRLSLQTADGRSYNVLAERFRFISNEGDTLYYVRPPLPDLDSEIVSAAWTER